MKLSLKGSRGEWFVVVQVILFALILSGPRGGTLPLPTAATWAGGLLMLAGGGLFVAGITRLGRRNLTPLPFPRKGGILVRTGPYRLVRHPIYGGGILLALGWALWVRGGLTLAYALLLWGLCEWKIRGEERWLLERYPDYTEYRKRVRKFIPFIY